MIALRIDHLNRSFGSLVVTDDVSLDIAAGERHVIIGPNGAGKTSLVNQIGGQLAPSSGHILVDGQDITGRSPDRISRMGGSKEAKRTLRKAVLNALWQGNLAEALQHLEKFRDTASNLEALEESDRVENAIYVFKLDSSEGNWFPSFVAGAPEIENWAAFLEQTFDS